MASRGRPRKVNPPELPDENEEQQEEVEESSGGVYYLSLDSSDLVITLYGGKYDHRINDVLEEAVEIEFSPLRDDTTLMSYGIYHTTDEKLIVGIEQSKPFKAGRVRKFEDFEAAVQFALEDAKRRILSEAQNKDELIDSEEFVKSGM